MTESTIDMDRAMQGIDDADNQMTVPEPKWEDFLNHKIPDGTRIKVTDRNNQIYVARNGQWELEIK